MTGPQRRFAELDGLRGLAVGAVLVYHYTSPFDGYYPGMPSAPFDFVDGEYGVQLFFLISGFVILLTAERARVTSDFVIARVTRLYPTYWAALALTTAVIVVSRAEPVRVTLAQVLVNTTMLQRFVLVENVDRVYWTLALELVFYAYLAIYLAVTRCRISIPTLRRLTSAWVLGSVPICLWAAGHPGSEPAKAVLTLTLAEYAGLFAAGMMFYVSRSREVIEPLAFGFGGVAILDAAIMRGFRGAVVVTFVVLLFAAVVAAPRVGLLARGPLHALGVISYPLYLVHQVVGVVLLAALIPVLGRVPAMVAVSGVVIAISVVLHATIEGPVSRRVRTALLNARANARAARDRSRGRVGGAE
jgi:peptidoglycan/LPS O-acetylase OafA/YrhL